MGLHVVESGPADGKPVVFLHGAAVHGGMWQPQVDELSRDLRCIVVDLPGHGESAVVPWESLDHAAELVADAITARPGGRASVVGMSLGGYVAVRLAMTHPDLLTSVIVSGVSVVPASFSVRMWQRGQLMTRYTALGRLVSPGARAVGTVGGGDHGGRPVGPPMSRQASAKIAQELTGFELPDSPRRTSCAFLAVAGEHENREALVSLRTLADRFEPGWAKYVPDAGHSWHVEYPGLFNAMVHSWVSAQRLPPKLRDPEQWTG